jgi:hypothetical protein
MLYFPLQKDTGCFENWKKITALGSKLAPPRESLIFLIMYCKSGVFRDVLIFAISSEMKGAPQPISQVSNPGPSGRSCLLMDYLSDVSATVVPFCSSPDQWYHINISLTIDYFMTWRLYLHTITSVKINTRNIYPPKIFEGGHLLHMFIKCLIVFGTEIHGRIVKIPKTLK